MSFADTLKNGFKNVGHYIAIGAKYLVTGLEDVVKVANQGQAIAPEVETLLAAIAGPGASKIADLAFHALGDIAQAIGPLEADASQVAQGAVSLTLDAQFVADVKAAAAQIEKVLSALGHPKPSA